MNNEIQKFDFKGAPLRTLTDKAVKLRSSSPSLVFTVL